MPEDIAENAAIEGSEAAAIFLMLLDEVEAAEVLGRLEPDEVKQLGGAMFGVADVTESQVNGVLDQFIRRARERTTIGFGADQQIRSMMERALGPDRADKVLARITPPQRSATLDALKWMDASTIAALIENEHPQIAALAIAHLDPAMAAEVLQLLDDEKQADVVYRVATLRPVTAEALEELETILLRQVTSKGHGITTRRGGTGEAARVLNNTKAGTDQRIIRSLTRLDKGLARAIEDEMFVFDNLMEVDERSLGTLLRSVESETLVLALKGADERLRAKMLGCMSNRAAQTIQDEIAERGPTRLTEVQEAQREVLTVARRLAEAGTIMLGGKSDDYV